MRAVLVIGSAALALTACQKSPGASSATATPDTATATAGAPAATDVTTSGTPHRRSGLWQQTFSKDGKTFAMGGMKMCVDEAMEAKASVFKPNGPQSAGDTHCAYPAPTRGLDGSFSFTATCPISGGGQTVTKGVASGDWSNSYHIEIQNDTTGASYAAMNGHHVMDIDGKWLGPCPTGMAGGDIEFGNGMKFSGGKLAGAAAMLRGATGGGSPGQ